MNFEGSFHLQGLRGSSFWTSRCFINSLCFFETHVASYPVMQCHVPEEQNPQWHCCEWPKQIWLNFVAWK